MGKSSTCEQTPDCPTRTCQKCVPHRLRTSNVCGFLLKTQTSAYAWKYQPAHTIGLFAPLLLRIFVFPLIPTSSSPHPTNPDNGPLQVKRFQSAHSLPVKLSWHRPHCVHRVQDSTHMGHLYVPFRRAAALCSLSSISKKGITKGGMGNCTNQGLTCPPMGRALEKKFGRLRLVLTPPPPSLQPPHDRKTKDTLWRRGGGGG